MMTSFGEHLADLLHTHDWSRRRFARLTGTSSSYIDFIVTGRRNPPKRITVLQHWADVLELSTVERRRFFDLADLCRTPESVRKRMSQLEEENQRLRQHLSDLRRLGSQEDPDPDQRS